MSAGVGCHEDGVAQAGDEDGGILLLIQQGTLRCCQQHLCPAQAAVSCHMSCCWGMLTCDSVWLCMPQVQFMGLDTGLQAPPCAGSRSAHHAESSAISCHSTASLADPLCALGCKSAQSIDLLELEQTRQLLSWVHSATASFAFAATAVSLLRNVKQLHCQAGCLVSPTPLRTQI